MNEFQTPYIYFCLANFLFVAATFICGFVRWFHVCDAYRENKEFYFPARKIVTGMFVVQLFQSVYWWNVFSDETFFFALLFSTLVTTPFYVMMEKRYFFFYAMRLRELFAHFSIPVLLLLPLLYDIIAGKSLFAPYRFEMKIIATCYVLFELYILVRTQWHVRKIIRDEYEMQYADLSHFPKSYARRKRGITFILSLMLLFVLWANSQSLKLFSDLILSIAAVQFLIEILSPKRTLFIEAPCPTDFQEIKKSKPKLLSSDQQKEIEQQIIIFLVHNELFRNPDLSLDLLVKEIGTNRTYISEAIRVSRYGSFYKMVNHYRLEYACTKMMQNPEIKMEYLASDCGYSSRFVFARAFKDVYGETPSEWKRTNCNME